MRTTTRRFVTGSLASAAVASALTLAGPAFAADAPVPPCGQPAAPAVYLTVIREGVLVQVPAVTHDEWRWQRTVTVLEHQYSRVVEAAHIETDWTRTLPGTTEYEWVRTVVDQVAQAEVPPTDETGHWEDVVGLPTGSVVEYEYRQQTTGNLRWAADGWNGEVAGVDHGKGWTKTGRARQWVVDHPATPGSPAVEAKSHLVTRWAPVQPGSDWSATGAWHTVAGVTETTTTADGARPVGDGWVQVGVPRTFPAVVETVWAATAPDGWTSTGAERERDVLEQSDRTSPAAPEGDGWTAIEGSRTTVVDVPAHTETVGGSTEQVLVSPAQDATAPCPAAAANPAPSSAHAGTSADAPAPVWLLADAVQAGHHASKGNGAHTGTQVESPRHAAAGPTSAVLPAAGSPVSPLLLATGLGALLTGGALVRSGRRRA